MLAALAPDVLVLGGDYVFLEVNERDGARARGARRGRAGAHQARGARQPRPVDAPPPHRARARARRLPRADQRRAPLAGAARRFAIVGIDEPWTGRADGARAFAASDAPIKIAVSHAPEGLAVRRRARREALAVRPHARRPDRAAQRARSSCTARSGAAGRRACISLADMHLFVSRGLGLVDVPLRAYAPVRRVAVHAAVKGVSRRGFLGILSARDAQGQLLGDALKTLKLPLLLNTYYRRFVVRVARVREPRVAHRHPDAGRRQRRRRGHRAADGRGRWIRSRRRRTAADTTSTLVDNCDVDGGSIDGGDAGRGRRRSAVVVHGDVQLREPRRLRALRRDAGDRTPTIPRPPTDSSASTTPPIAFCGRGAMAIDVDFDGHTRIGGEIVIPISPTARLHRQDAVARDEGERRRAVRTCRFTVLLVTTAIRAEERRSADHHRLGSTVSVVLPDMPDASADRGHSNLAARFTAQLTPYIGTVYIDEIDVQRHARRRRATTALSTRAPIDARDGGAGDVRDAPAGS